MSSQAQSIHVITVDSTPAKAKEFLAGLIKATEKDYSLVHVANCEAIKDVKPVLTSLVIAPKVLVNSPLLFLYLDTKADCVTICSSKLFDEEEEIREIAQRLLPEIKLVMVPHDLHAPGGGNAVVELLVEQITKSKLPTKE